MPKAKRKFKKEGYFYMIIHKEKGLDDITSVDEVFKNEELTEYYAYNPKYWKVVKVKIQIIEGEDTNESN